MSQETQVINTEDEPVPVKIAGAVLDKAVGSYREVGAIGWIIVLIGILVGVGQLMSWFTLRSGQETFQKTQDHLYDLLKEEQRSSSTREEKLIDRSDKISRDQYDRWEKSRERTLELITKVDLILSEIRRVPIVQPEKK